MKLWRCEVCGYVHEKELAPDTCPKCCVGPENFALLSSEETNKICRSDKTNDYHMQLVHLAMQMDEIARQGIADDLDFSCIRVFERAKQYAWEMKQMAKVELAEHISKGKY